MPGLVLKNFAEPSQPPSGGSIALIILTERQGRHREVRTGIMACRPID